MCRKLFSTKIIDLQSSAIQLATVSVNLSVVDLLTDLKLKAPQTHNGHEDGILTWHALVKQRPFLWGPFYYVLAGILEAFYPFTNSNEELFHWMKLKNHGVRFGPEWLTQQHKQEMCSLSV